MNGIIREHIIIRGHVVGSARKIGNVVRIIALIVGGFIVLFFLVFIVGEGITGGKVDEGYRLTQRETGMFIFLG